MIVDASVAIKWLVPEEDSDLAQRLVALHELTAPDFISAEIANAIWKKWGRGEIVGVPPSLTVILDSFDELEPTSALAFRAAEIAIELNHPAYDCLYLALAEKTGEKIVTVDAKLLRKLAGTSYSAMIVSLEEAVA